MGGRQHCPQVAVPSERHVIPSDQLLTVEGLCDANELMAVAGSKRILILGGSHSAYAAAGALLELPAAQQLARGQVVIVQRREPRIFYPDQDAARHDGYDVAPGDICPRTQRVNRMGGLRGYGRETWRQITDRPGLQPETRVVRMALQDLSATELRTAIDTAALVVPCFGYRSVTLPVFDSNGERFELNADKGGIAVGDDCRLLTADQRKLPNLFGIGLGTGYRLPASMGGEPNFDGQANSLWLYQNDIGATIYRAIDELSPALPPRLRLTSSGSSTARRERASPSLRAQIRVSDPSAATTPEASRNTWLMVKELVPKRETWLSITSFSPCCEGRRKEHSAFTRGVPSFHWPLVMSSLLRPAARNSR